MARVVEFFSNDRLEFGEISACSSKKISVSDRAGRMHRLVPDRVLFEHDGELEALVASVEALQATVDVPLLWESLRSEEDTSAKPSAELARLYFDRSDSVHASAIFRAVYVDRIHFRRRGLDFSPRSEEEVAAVRKQRDVEAQVARECAVLEEHIKREQVDEPLARRIARWLRGHTEDKVLFGVLASKANDAHRFAFDLLVRCGRASATDDLAVWRADLRADHPPQVHAAAQAYALRPPNDVALAGIAIDDPDTREVDDALSAEREGEFIRVDVDIADVARVVAPDDAVDREAFRRGTTVYLPTGCFYMLPESVGCTLASLVVGKPRPSMCIRIWLDKSGHVARYEITRRWLSVKHSLDYDTVDRMLLEQTSTHAVTEQLRLLQEAAQLRASVRRADGALFVHRPEWKLEVDPAGIVCGAKCINQRQASRTLVAEMMILANHVVARYAAEAGLPFMYRTQPGPESSLPPLDDNDPVGFLRLRGLLQPAALSLDPGRHFGLGLDGYTKVTSPLRRYGDLVMLRQVAAHLAGNVPPYDKSALLRVLAEVEQSESMVKRTEAAVQQRWALEYVAQRRDDVFAGRIVAELRSGYRCQLLACGAEGLLVASTPLKLGSEVDVTVDQVRPRRGALRLALRGSGSKTGST